MLPPFREPCPELISPQPGGPCDPLGESVCQDEQPAWRVFEPQDVRIVIGRHQDPRQEILVDAAQADRIPMHRRVAGGGTVVLAPGMLVVALRMQRRGLAVDAYFDRVNAILQPEIQAQLQEGRVATYGHGDLAIATDASPARKILGASLRQSRDFAYYLGVIMVADAVPLMRRYLAFPSRQPDYRDSRDHGAFCTHLGAWGVAIDRLQAALRSACQAAQPI